MLHRGVRLLIRRPALDTALPRSFIKALETADLQEDLEHEGELLEIEMERADAQGVPRSRMLHRTGASSKKLGSIDRKSRRESVAPRAASPLWSWNRGSPPPMEGTKEEGPFPVQQEAAPAGADDTKSNSDMMLAHIVHAMNEHPTNVVVQRTGVEDIIALCQGDDAVSKARCATPPLAQLCLCFTCACPAVP